MASMVLVGANLHFDILAGPSDVEPDSQFTSYHRHIRNPMGSRGVGYPARG